MNLEGLAFSNQICYRWNVHQHLNYGQASIPVGAMDQRLGHDPSKAFREHYPYLSLLSFRKGINDPVYRFGGAVGV